MVWTHNHWIRCRCSNWLSYQTVNLTRCQIQLFRTTPISSLCSVFTFHFGLCLPQLPHLLLAKSRTGNHVVAEWIDTYDIPHWKILRSSSRKLAWVGCEPTTAEFRSDFLAEWTIRPWVQLALRATIVQLLQFHIFVQYSRFIRSMPWSVTTFALSKALHRPSCCSGMDWYIWYSRLTELYK